MLPPRKFPPFFAKIALFFNRKRLINDMSFLDIPRQFDKKITLINIDNFNSQTQL